MSCFEFFGSILMDIISELKATYISGYTLFSIVFSGVLISALIRLLRGVLGVNNQ